MQGRQTLIKADPPILQFLLYRKEGVACSTQNGATSWSYSSFHIGMSLSKKGLKLICNALGLLRLILPNQEFGFARYRKLEVCFRLLKSQKRVNLIFTGLLLPP